MLLKTSKVGSKGELTHEEVAKVPYNNEQIVFQVEVNNNEAQFRYGDSLANLKPLGKLQDFTILSDEVTQRFNGNFVGMYATSEGQKSNQTAKFDWFEYQPIN